MHIVFDIDDKMALRTTLPSRARMGMCMRLYAAYAYASSLYQALTLPYSTATGC